MRNTTRQSPLFLLLSDLNLRLQHIYVRFYSLWDWWNGFSHDVTTQKERFSYDATLLSFWFRGKVVEERASRLIFIQEKRSILYSK